MCVRGCHKEEDKEVEVEEEEAVENKGLRSRQTSDIDGGLVWCSLPSGIVLHAAASVKTTQLTEVIRLEAITKQ